MGKPAGTMDGVLISVSSNFKQSLKVISKTFQMNLHFSQLVAKMRDNGLLYLSPEAICDFQC